MTARAFKCVYVLFNTSVVVLYDIFVSVLLCVLFLCVLLNFDSVIFLLCEFPPTYIDVCRVGCKCLCYCGPVCILLCFYLCSSLFVLLLCTACVLLSACCCGSCLGVGVIWELFMCALCERFFACDRVSTNFEKAYLDVSDLH